MKRFISRPKPVQALAALMAIFIVLAFVRAWVFFWFPGLPALYAKDLGFGYLDAEYMRNLVHGALDFKDMLSWSPWYDQPYFFYNAHFSTMAVVPLTAIFANTWASIKFLEVASLCAAAAGVFLLMRLFGRDRLWSLIAGMIYACVPFVDLGPRGNLDLGAPGVLLPFCLAFGVMLIRRFGSRSLPLCAILCSLCGLCPIIEYGLFVSFPAYFILAAYAWQRSRSTACAIYGAIGALVLPLFAAYYLLPTFSNHVFSDSAIRIKSLQAASFSSYFSEHFIEMLAMVPREAVLAPDVYYNATAQLTTALIGGITLWIFAIIGFVRSASIWNRPAAAVALLIVLIFAFLSIASSLPGGDVVARLTAALPLVRAIRTPDRYMTLPVLFIVAAACDGLRGFFRDRFDQSVSGFIFVAAIIAAFFSFAVGAHIWENQQDYGSVEPDLQKANRVVASIGERTVSYALVNGGSPADAPAYGVPTPTISGVWEFGARYGQDGIASTGLFRRAGVRSVIASPNWAASVASDVPDFAGVLSGVRTGKVVFRSNSGITISRLANSDPAVSAVRLACLEGGPGLLDHLLQLDALNGLALVRHGRCASDVLANYDPLDKLPAAAIVSRSGQELCPDCIGLHDADYNYDPGRSLLAVPWYRDSIDGDDPAFGGAAVLLPSADYTMRLAVPRLRNRRLLLLLHASVHAYSRIDVRAGSQHSFSLLPSRGLRWLRFPLGDAAGFSTIELTVHQDRYAPTQLNASWYGFALDGVAVAIQPLLKPRTESSRSIAAVVFTADRIGEPKVAPVVSVDLLAPRQSRQGQAAAFQTSTPDSAPATVVRTRREKHSFRWNGQAGRYLVVAGGSLHSTRSRLELGAGPLPAACCLSVAYGNPAPVATTAFGYAQLKSGDYVNVLLESRRPDETVDAVRVVSADGAIRVSRAGFQNARGHLDFAEGPVSLSHVLRFSNITGRAFDGVGLLGSAGTQLQVRVVLDEPVSSMSVSFDGLSSSGSAGALLKCGSQSVSATISRRTKTAVSIHPDGTECSLAVRWLRAMRISSLTVYAQLRDRRLAGSLFIPAGRYRVAILRPSLAPDSQAQLVTDGQAYRNDRVASLPAGMHQVSLSNGQSDADVIEFLQLQTAPGVGGVTARRVAALRDAITVSAPAAVKVNHLYDGNWTLLGAQGVAAVRCDLVDTCFSTVARGNYVLYHRWNAPLKIGFLLSALSLVLALFLVIGVRDKRSPSRARSSPT